MALTDDQRKLLTVLDDGNLKGWNEIGQYWCVMNGVVKVFKTYPPLAAARFVIVHSWGLEITDAGRGALHDR